MRAVVVFLALLVFACSCGSTRARTPQDGAASVAPDAAATTGDVEASVDMSAQPPDPIPFGWQPDAALPPAVACGQDVLTCSAWNDTDIALPLAAIAEQCQACGDFVVAFVEGCAAEVHLLNLDVRKATIEACLSSAIVGRRWACAPANEWVKSFVDCTLF